MSLNFGHCSNDDWFSPSSASENFVGLYMSVSSGLSTCLYFISVHSCVYVCRCMCVCVSVCVSACVF